jgi:hypothetical protein
MEQTGKTREQVLAEAEQLAAPQVSYDGTDHGYEPEDEYSMDGAYYEESAMSDSEWAVLQQQWRDE